MLDVAQRKAKAESIGNYFAESVISKKKQDDALLDADDRFKDLQDQLDKLASHTSELFLGVTTVKGVLSMKDFVSTTQPIMNDEEIMSEVLNEENIESEEDGDCDVDIFIEQTDPKLGFTRQELELL